MFLSKRKTQIFTENRQNGFHIAFSYGFSAIIAQGLMMVYTVIIARWLLPEEYGIISACYAMATLASFGINWGFDIWLLREASAADDPIYLTSSILRSKFFLGIIWTFLLWGLLQYIQPNLYEKNISLLVIIDTWLEACFTTMLIHFVVVKKSIYASLFLILSRFLRLFLAILLIIINKSSLLSFSIFRLSSTFIILFSIWIIIKPKLFSKNNIPLTALFRFSLPYTASELLNILYLQSDVNILAVLIGDKKMVGNYSLAINLITAILTLPYGIINVYIPNLVHKMHTNKYQFKTALLELYLIISILSILITVGLWFFGESMIITFLGELYLNTGRLLVLLCPIIIIKCINQVNSAYLISVDLQSKRLFPQFTSLLVKICSSIVIVPRWRDTGLAILSIFSEFILFLGYSFLILSHAHKYNYFKNENQH